MWMTLRLQGGALQCYWTGRDAIPPLFVNENPGVGKGLSGHRSGLRGASNAMISRNRTFVTVYLAGACEKRPHTVLSLIPSLQGLEPNVYSEYTRIVREPARAL